jgi:hypothetical protein
MRKQSPHKQAHDQEMRSLWEETEAKRDLVTDQQRQRRKQLAQKNRELIDQLKARFESEET